MNPLAVVGAAGLCSLPSSEATGCDLGLGFLQIDVR